MKDKPKFFPDDLVVLTCDGKRYLCKVEYCKEFKNPLGNNYIWSYSLVGLTGTYFDHQLESVLSR